MFFDLLVCGMGWSETRIDFTESIDGEVRVDRIDPLDMRWDPNAKKRNLSDSRWRARILRLTKKQFKEMFPKQNPDLFFERADQPIVSFKMGS